MPKLFQNKEPKPKIYYYWHAESGALWSQNIELDNEHNDGLVEPITKKQAVEIMKQLGETTIVHQEFTEDYEILSETKINPLQKEKAKPKSKEKVLSCEACGLYKDVISPRMRPFGNFKKQIMVIGEAPGETEDQENKQWQGKAGRLLQREFRKCGIDLFEDCVNINSVNCRPTSDTGANRTPSKNEIENCRRIVLRAINYYKPKLIILLGNIALESIIGYRWKKDLGGITKWRGWQIPDQDFQAWICPTFHPSYVMREDKPEVDVVWHDDLIEAFKKLRETFPVNIEPEIEIIEDLSILDKASFKSETMAMDQSAPDFETTGLKPHGAGQRIVSCAIANNPNHAYAFLIPKTRAEREPIIRYLTNDKIVKLGANIKFEENWSVVRLKTNVARWGWDTVIAAHLLDNRTGVTSVKFQVYVNFGIIDYASEVAPYLEGVDPKNSNSLNRILELIEMPGGKELLLKYNGYDAIYEYRLAELQRSKIINLSLPF